MLSIRFGRHIGSLAVYWAAPFSAGNGTGAASTASAASVPSAKTRNIGAEWFLKGPQGDEWLLGMVTLNVDAQQAKIEFVAKTTSGGQGEQRKGEEEDEHKN